GASIVVYLGHGNGFPSPYRDSLYPPTQNGLGLNPVAGGGDTAHQYFGEAFLAREIRLAPGAVVLLHHLCYASGNSEPGLPEGSLAVAQQRVDNYAAGWLRAGAGAVIADTFGAPEPYLRGLLGGDQTVDRLWRDVPSNHDHVLTFASTRSPGHQVAMDPTRVGSGFNRSIVWTPGLTGTELRAGAGQVAKGAIGSTVTPTPTVTSLAALGVTFRTPGLAPAGATPSGLVAGTRATLTLPIKVPKDATLPATLKLGLRWDPVALDGPPPATSNPGGTPTGGAGTAGGSTASPGPTPSVSPTTPPRGRPAPSPSPSVPPGPVATEPPAIEAVAPEVAGSVVTPVRAKLVKGRLRMTLVLPASAGVYRLVTTVHDGDGVAFDATTQALIPTMSVRISGALSVAYGVAATLTVRPGAQLTLPVRVANDGALAWGRRPDAADVSEELIDPSVARQYPRARLVGRWVPLAIDGSSPTDLADASISAQPDPGTEITVGLDLRAPTTPGAYLLLLDIASPLRGSLAAAGVAPGQVRVVVDPAAPAVSPGAP
ncbi:MAG TPA: hypothetical protein VLR93_10465, partial [Patescibacteria group bacterium]|nr:hypothetical protein [Patescibacteria group bacterium]